MSHWFHNWIYSERIGVRGQKDPEHKSIIFNKRACRKCGKIQQNEGRFVYGFCGYVDFVSRWFTIGYKKVKK